MREDELKMRCEASKGLCSPLLFMVVPERRRRRRHLCLRELEAGNVKVKRDECVQGEMDECMSWPKRMALVEKHDVDVGVGEGLLRVES